MPLRTMINTLHRGLAILCLSLCPLEAAERFPGPQRLDVLLIGQPHGYGGTQAADCLMLESLSNLRFHTVPVPHDSGDHVADVDGHFGKDLKWVPIRRDAILAALKQPHDAVLVAAPIPRSRRPSLITSPAAARSSGWPAADCRPRSR